MVERLSRIIKASNNIVFFGGAGVSTESGIPDFRSSAGIYSKKTYPFPAEIMISSNFFYAHPKQFYDFYVHEMIYPDAQPNEAHVALAKLEKMGKVKAVITQNIDGLHQMAGSKEVLELHGSIHRNRCVGCHAFYDLAHMPYGSDHVPVCESCGQIVKPEVVLYGESLDQDVMHRAIAWIEQADVLIIGGTSLVVYPAAGLIQYFHGSHLVLINRSQTSMDDQADIVIHDSIGKVMSSVISAM
ncbi:MAG: NAD-dependent protein deacylase [Erysipelotrichaceae bacterium]|nr:NAD-dependent protein deacylase [Erysipelotrichaceae bacterium]MCI9523940.1 NAD-dependent protein deacylase [Erysipelotrichaceae bacterium]